MRSFSYSAICAAVIVGLFPSQLFAVRNKRGGHQVPAVTGISLVSVADGRVLSGQEQIAEGARLSFNQLQSGAVDLHPTLTKKTGSVRIRLKGPQGAAARVRNRPPYRWALKDNGQPHRWEPQVGEYSITVTPFSRRNAHGRRGKSYRLRFIVDEAVSPAPPPDAPLPIPTITPDPVETPLPDDGSLSVWANEGGDKVTREELRRTGGGDGAVINGVWDGAGVNLFGARNEVVSFNLVLEAPRRDLRQIRIAFDRLEGPNGARITTVPASGDQIFDYRGRNIELFYVRYLQIRGLSLLGYGTGGEEQMPERLQSADGGGWESRPDHDRFYPDIAVPSEAMPRIDVRQGTSQSAWADIYVPKDTPAGDYRGIVWIFEGTNLLKKVPVALQVRGFTLPDAPHAKTMVYMGLDANLRYLGRAAPQGQTETGHMSAIRDRHFQMAHRHKISLIDDNDSYGASADQPSPAWLPRLSGALFEMDRGYDGPGRGVGNDIFAIAPYGNWKWAGNAEMQRHADAWVSWFEVSAPATEYFLYLIDEVYDFAKINGWAAALNSSAGAGKRLMSFATISAASSYRSAPDLDIACSMSGSGGGAEQWQAARSYYSGSADKRFWFYNGRRPQTGSFMIEDDGVALRQLAWAQYKLGVQRWFYWESTYYNNFQHSGPGQTNVFQQAHTFGTYTGDDARLGETGVYYSNGDGVLFYPGTDRVFPAESYGLTGPIASIRLKLWRRGIQDVDYLTLAARAAPERVERIVSTLLPAALWQSGSGAISWSTSADAWEDARRELADIIEAAER